MISLVIEDELKMMIESMKDVLENVLQVENTLKNSDYKQLFFLLNLPKDNWPSLNQRLTFVKLLPHSPFGVNQLIILSSSRSPTTSSYFFR